MIGDVREVVKILPDNFVDCIITSPPYWMQRDYNHPNQIGLEKTPEEYVNEISDVFEKLRNKLKRTACIFLNVGYKYLNGELILIPEMIALEMKRRGFTLKNKIIWWKPNAMPTPARDRLNDVYEPVLFFIRNDGKAVHYFNVDEIAEKPATIEDYARFLSIEPKDLLGARVLDPFSGRHKKKGKVAGIRCVSDSPLEVFVAWNDGSKEWVPFGNLLKNYPEKTFFACPHCGAVMNHWEISLSFANFGELNCPNCGKKLCDDVDSFPRTLYNELPQKSQGEMKEIINFEVEIKKYITKTPKSSKFIKAGLEEITMASPAGRLAVQGEYITIKRRWDPPQPLIAEFLRFWRELRKVTTEEIDKALGYSYTAGHWFRKDYGWWGRGGSIPRPSDWVRLKSLLRFNDVYDRLVCESIAVLQTVKPHEEGRNPGDIWKITLEQYPETHFSIFPTKLVETAIKLGCPRNGVVLDPFAGSGTVGQVAMKLERKAILIELLPEFLDLMKKRCGGRIEVLPIQST
jgi:DNA modification methylase